MSRTTGAARALSLGLSLAAAGALGAGCSLIPRDAPTVPAQLELIPCPQQLVNVDLPLRPEEPTWGEDDLADLATAWTELEAYTDGLEEQAAKRQEQVTECHTRVRSDG